MKYLYLLLVAGVFLAASIGTAWVVLDFDDEQTEAGIILQEAYYESDEYMSNTSDNRTDYWTDSDGISVIVEDEMIYINAMYDGDAYSAIYSYSTSGLGRDVTVYFEYMHQNHYNYEAWGQEFDDDGYQTGYTEETFLEILEDLTPYDMAIVAETLGR